MLEISFCVGVDLLACQRRACFGNSGRIADHCRKIADQEDGGVAHVLKVFEFAEDDGVAEVQIGSGGIDAEIDAEGFAGFDGFGELCFQFFFANDFGAAFFEVGELFFNGFEIRGHGCC